MKNRICFFIFLLFASFSAALAAEALPTGYKVFSPHESYMIIKELGEGVFGKVYMVSDSHQNLFALKSFKPYEGGKPGWDLMSDPIREFEYGQTLNHPNIIRSFELFKGPSDGTYLVLELVMGKKIAELGRKSLTYEQACNLAFQLIDAVLYADSSGYLYLDLHTKNVMINSLQTLKMIDIASFFSWDEIIALKNKKGVQPLTYRELKILKFFENLPRLQSAKNPQAKFRGIFYIGYFERVTDMCIALIKVSTLPKEEKIRRILEIQTLSLNFSEDVLDGKYDLDFHDYIQALKLHLR